MNGGEDLRKERLLRNTALLTGSSLLMSLIGLAFQAWLAGRIGAAGLGLVGLVGSVSALGSRASHGCIRLEVEAAEWLYKNCKRGSLVIVIY